WQQPAVLDLVRVEQGLDVTGVGQAAACRDRSLAVQFHHRDRVVPRDHDALSRVRAGADARAAPVDDDRDSHAREQACARREQRALGKCGVSQLVHHVVITTSHPYRTILAYMDEIHQRRRGGQPGSSVCNGLQRLAHLMNRARGTEAAAWTSMTRWRTWLPG